MMLCAPNRMVESVTGWLAMVNKKSLLISGLINIFSDFNKFI
jgi:hypothetical protein